MTSHVGRLYAASISIVVFFLTWLVIAARPWLPHATDPRLAALAAREQQLQVESAVVQRVVNDRWATYRRELARRQAQNAAAAAAPAPRVRIVTLPPVTTTKSS
jgi:hypothetical protein